MKVIFLTGNDDDHFRKLADKAGASAFLPKTSSRSELTAMIRLHGPA